MKKRTLFFRISLLIILLIILYFLRPISLKPLISDKNSMPLQVIHIEGTRDIRNGPHQKIYTYDFSSSSDEYKDFCKLFEKYYYHISLSTFTKNNTTIGGRDYISIKTSDHSIDLTGTDKIIIDDIPYRIGYLGKSKGKALTNDFIKILKKQ